VQGQHVLVCDGTNRQIHRLSRVGLKEIDKTGTLGAFNYILPLGGLSDHYLAYSEDAPPTLLSRNSWGRGPDRQIPFRDLPSYIGADADGRSLILAGAPGQPAFEFTVLSLPTTVQDYISLHTFRKRPNTSPQTIAAYEQRFRSGIRRFTVATQPSGPVLPTVLLCRPSRLICGRLVVRLGLTPRAEGIFEPSPYTRSNNPALRERRSFFQIMDSIVSVSANGRYAASGLCVYDVDTRKVLKMLPVPTLMHTFSLDGKHLYLANGTNRQLYVLEDWQKNAPDPEKGL
jgi:hypothetical protein